MKGSPASKITKFSFGELKKQFPHKVILVSNEEIQIRHNALDSARVVAFRKLTKLLGKEFHLQIRGYPHHILRENKMILGAGADRMQTGMQKAFGRPMGLAAQFRKKTPIFCVYVEKQGIPAALDALRTATYKLPGKCGVVVE